MPSIKQSGAGVVVTGTLETRRKIQWLSQTRADKKRLGTGTAAGCCVSVDGSSDETSDETRVRAQPEPPE